MCLHLEQTFFICLSPFPTPCEIQIPDSDSDFFHSQRGELRSYRCVEGRVPFSPRSSNQLLGKDLSQWLTMKSRYWRMPRSCQWPSALRMRTGRLGMLHTRTSRWLASASTRTPILAWQSMVRRDDDGLTWFESSDRKLASTGGLFIKAVGDSNAAAQDKALESLVMYLSKATDQHAVK